MRAQVSVVPGCLSRCAQGVTKGSGTTQAGRQSSPPLTYPLLLSRTGPPFSHRCHKLWACWDLRNGYMQWAGSDVGQLTVVCTLGCRGWGSDPQRQFLSHKNTSSLRPTATSGVTEIGTEPSFILVFFLSQHMLGRGRKRGASLCSHENSTLLKSLQKDKGGLGLWRRLCSACTAQKHPDRMRGGAKWDLKPSLGPLAKPHALCL